MTEIFLFRILNLIIGKKNLQSDWLMIALIWALITRCNRTVCAIARAPVAVNGYFSKFLVKSSRAFLIEFFKQKMKLSRISQIFCFSKLNWWPNVVSSNSVCNHTRIKQIGQPLRGRPLLFRRSYDYRLQSKANLDRLPFFRTGWTSPVIRRIPLQWKLSWADTLGARKRCPLLELAANENGCDK